MDKLIYTAMTGAKHTLGQQAAVANNLANATTDAFRSEFMMLRSVLIQGDGMNTRAFVVDSSPGTDFSPGPIQTTGREFDVAILGRGWFAVQAPNGSEAYTRDGSFEIGNNGQLQTRAGHLVLGDGGGPIAIPPDVRVEFAADGTITSVPTDNQPNQVAQVGILKLVDPPDALMARGADGLFRARDGAVQPASAAVQITPGALEGSNVNVVEQMVAMIALARQFDMQMKMMENAERNDQNAAQLLSTAR